MPRASRTQRQSSRLIFVGALLAGAFLVLVGISLAQEFRRRYLLQEHIRALRADIEAREAHVQELKRLKEYLSTDAYVERAAREKLNYPQPGATVVGVPRQPAPTPTAPPAPVRKVGPPSAVAWFRLLFGPSALPGSGAPR